MADWGAIAQGASTVVGTGLSIYQTEQQKKMQDKALQLQRQQLSLSALAQNTQVRIALIAASAIVLALVIIYLIKRK